MDVDVHKAIHANNTNAGIAKSGVGGGGGPFNWEWWKFFRENPEATTDEVLVFLHESVEATTPLLPFARHGTFSGQFRCLLHNLDRHGAYNSL